MNWKQTVVAALVTMAALLSGCAMQLVNVDPNRPYPPQPAVATEVVSALSGKNLKEIPVYVSVARYYDTTDFEKKVAETEKEKGRKLFFVRDLPVTYNPPRATVENANRFLASLKSELDKAGFRRVEVPCEQCLVLISDYTDATVHTGATFIMSRIRAYYLGNEVMVARDDRSVWWTGGESFRNEAIALAAKRAREELEQVYSARISYWRQQVCRETRAQSPLCKD